MNEARDHLLEPSKSMSSDSSELDQQCVKQNTTVEFYEAGGGKNSYHGVDYQLRLLIFFILRGLENKYSFSLATDMKNAEKFDDVVLRLQNKSSGGHVYRLLQAKHRAGNNPGKITTSALLSGNASGDFSLRAYCESYLKLRSKFSSAGDQIQDIIICTNVGFKNNDPFGSVKLSDAIVLRENVDEIFHSKLLRFKEDFEGKEVLIGTLKEQLEGVTHDEDDIEEFLDKLTFAMKQYGNDDLEKKNKELFKKEFGFCDVETVFPIFEKKIREWMMSFEGRYFSAEEAQTFIDSLKDKFGGMTFEFYGAVCNFIGRNRELDELETARMSGFKTVVISGLGGMGKTELARKYVEKHSSMFRRIVWMTADSRGAISNSFQRLAERLGIVVKGKTIKTILDEVYAYFEGSDSVFVLDNVEGLNFEEGRNDYLKDFLPPAPKRPFVILTSRLQCNWKDVHNLALSEIEENDAVDFLKSNLPAETHSSLGECLREFIKRVAKKLQNFPLALQQAVAYIKKRHLSSSLLGEKYGIEDYLESFVKEANEILSCKILSSSRPDYDRTTISTWIMTFKSIKESACGEMAEKILSLLSCFAPDNIKTKNIIVYFGERRREEVAESLCLLKDFSVIVLRGNAISIHRLVQKVIRLRLKETGEEDKILRWALESASEIDVDHRISLWEKISEYKNMQREYSHLPSNIIDSLINSVRYEHACLFGRTSLLAFENICEVNNASRLKAMDSFATALYLNGKYEEALRVNETIFFIAREEVLSGDLIKLRDKYNIAVGNYIPGTNTKAFVRKEHHEGEKGEINRDDTYLLNSICKIADCCKQLEDYTKALENYKKAYEKERNILGDDHPNLHLTKNNIAKCYSDLGDRTKALKLYQEIDDEEKEKLENNSASMLSSKHGMASWHSNLGDYAKALVLHKEVGKIREEILGDKHPDTLYSKYQIADCYERLGDFNKALKLSEEVYEKEVDILGEKHPETLRAKRLIGNCYHRLDNYNKALALYEDVYENQKQILGDSHTSTLTTKCEIAQCYFELCDYAKALSLYKVAYEKRVELLGEFHPSTLTTKFGLAMCHDYLGDYQKALLLYEEVYNKEVEILGDKHPDTLSTKCEIASCYNYLCDNKKALLLYEDVVEKRKQIFGSSHPSTLKSEYGIAQCHHDLGDYKKAKSIYEELYEKWVEILGDFHSSTLEAKYGIAMCYRSLGNNAKTLLLLEDIYEKEAEILGEFHPSALKTKKGIAKCYMELGDSQKALILLEEVHEKEAEIFGDKHPDTLNSKYEVAGCHNGLGDYNKALLLYEEVYEGEVGIFGEDNLSTLKTKCEIARCHKSLGDYTKALALFEEAYEKEKILFGEMHPDTLTAHNNIADCFSEKGDYPRALVIYAEVYDKRKEVFDDSNPCTLRSKSGLALCYSELGYYSKALVILEEVYDREKEIIGDKHPDSLKTKYNIAMCYSYLGENNKSLILFEEVYGQSKKILGGNHPDTVISKNGIAACFSKSGDCAKAITLFEEVYGKLKELLGEKHPKTLCSKYGMAVCYSDLGDNTKALTLLEDIYEKQEELLGDKHPETLTSLYGIADCYSRLGDNNKALEIYQEVIEKQGFEDNHPRKVAVRLRIQEMKKRKLKHHLSKMITILTLYFSVILIHKVTMILFSYVDS